MIVRIFCTVVSHVDGSPSRASAATDTPYFNQWCHNLNECKFSRRFFIGGARFACIQNRHTESMLCSKGVCVCALWEHAVCQGHAVIFQLETMKNWSGFIGSNKHRLHICERFSSLSLPLSLSSEYSSLMCNYIYAQLDMQNCRYARRSPSPHTQSHTKYVFDFHHFNCMWLFSCRRRLRFANKIVIVLSCWYRPTGQSTYIFEIDRRLIAYPHLVNIYFSQFSAICNCWEWGAQHTAHPIRTDDGTNKIFYCESIRFWRVVGISKRLIFTKHLQRNFLET